MARKVKKPRFVVGGQTLTSEEILALIAKGSDETAKLAGGVKVEADPRLLDAIQKTPLGEHVGDDGVIESHMTGVEELIAAQIVAVCVGFLIGLAVGLYLGSGDDGANGEAGGDADEDRNGGDSEGNGGGGEGGGEGGGGEGNGGGE